MRETPKGLRAHIAIAGRRNTGKSSLLNALSGQNAAIVSEQPGATTDPVEKTMELAPLGPVVFIDTAGNDDKGALGALRVERSMNILKRSDCAIIVTSGETWEEAEQALVKTLDEAGTPFLIVRNKLDLAPTGFMESRAWAAKAGLPPDIPVIDISTKDGRGLEEARKALASLSASKDDAKPLLADLAPASGLVLLVAPLDSGAPKGRLILPQVQAIRDCLDGHCICMITTEDQFKNTLKKLATQPDLIVCDSQVVKKICAEAPRHIPLTTFSILMARFKGNLPEFAKGAAALATLKPGDSALIQEACSHHPQKDDIGRVKIPRLLQNMAAGPLDIKFAAGKEITDYDKQNLKDVKAIVHCGGCVITGKQMEMRQNLARAHNIPMTNYGMALSLATGVLERTLAPFPEALQAFKNSSQTEK